ncbi:MAG: DNA polymerase III subunit delta, partial [Oscillospiraceae bacterium]|nr:DNA polymerase III subunit delta [Oscillospiraceae bacterium]
MGFESLLGNERLKENLRVSVGRGRISHFYLISGPEGSGKHTLARLLAAAILCKEQEKPCLKCNSCRKVLAQSHPDCITVEDPEHKNVAVKIVRDARADMYILPNEGDRKIYIFPQEMGIEGQNALLKILE